MNLNLELKIRVVVLYQTDIESLLMGLRRIQAVPEMIKSNFCCGRYAWYVGVTKTVGFNPVSTGQH